MTGDPAMPNPTTQKNFLADLPAHCYTLPDVPLNFTIVEILVLLPHWFRNAALCERFINNNLTGNIHFMILEEHREWRFETEHDREKARKWITDEYRKTMRKNKEGWVKLGYAAPVGWDSTAMGMAGFIPDDVEAPGYRRVPSILFKDLAIGVKKMPEGPAAADLTRALLFALESKPNYMFPEDLPTILNHIGRTHITTEHTDRPLVHAYSELKLREDMRKRQETNKANRAAQAQPTPHGYVAAQANQQGTPYGNVAAQASHRGVAVHEGTVLQMRDPSTSQQMAQQALDYGAPNLWQGTPQIIEAVPGDRPHGHRVENVQVDQSNEDMGGLLRQYLNKSEFQMVTIPPTGLEYAPDFQLRDCIEGNIAFDGSPLARAARFAQRQDQVAFTWCVEHVPFLNQLLDAARAESQT